jgi:hypothetical protein
MSAAPEGTEQHLPQFFRDRAMALLLGATLSGADDGCARLILASAAVGSGNLADALEHLAHAHQLDVTEACALSNRSIVLQLKGDHAEAFEAVKQAISLRFIRCCSLARMLPSNCHLPYPSAPQPIRPPAVQQPLRTFPQHEEIRRFSQSRRAMPCSSAPICSRA